MLQSSPNISPSNVSLGTEVFKLVRSGLRTWLTLEDTIAHISEAVGAKDIDGLVRSVCSYVSTALDISTEVVDSAPAADVISALEVCLAENKIRIEFPILSSSKKKSDIEPSWEYDGRAWYFWVNLLSSAYGWNMEYIAQIDPEDAIGLFQEISFDKHMEKEWEWGLSDIAYPYNPTTKKQEFKEYPRPEWMRDNKITAAPKQIKIRKDFLPVGNVISLQKNDKNTDTQRVL